ncbi:MAG: cellulose biosynthesis cyclic di-GMP-binding regulatory protein BcsB [Chloroflexota bacterium]
MITWRTSHLAWRAAPRMAAIALLAALLMPPALALAQAGGPRKVIRLADLGYNDDTLVGQRFTADYFFPGPGEYRLASSGSVLDLVYSASGLVGKSSVMTVLWNNVPLADVRLAGKGTPQRISVPLPADRIDPALNRLQIRGAMEDRSSVCTNDNPANHLTVFRDTSVHYALADSQPHPPPVRPDLGRYPAPFFEAAPLAPAPVVFVLPPTPAPDVLRAVAAISGGLGRSAGSHRLDLGVATDVGSPPASLAGSNLIYVGLARDLAGLRAMPGLSLRVGRDGHLLKDGKPVAPADGVLAEAASPLNAGRMVLAVVSQTSGGLVKAATTLASGDTARLLGGSSAVIERLDTAPPSARPSQAGGDVITLADLGRSDQSVSGIGDHDLTFKVQLPGVPQGRGGLALDLVTSHSPLLDAARSSFKVLVNGVPVTSVALNQVGVSHGVTRVQIPSAAIRPGVDTFDVVFTLRTARIATPVTQICPPVPTEQAWAVLHSSTNLQLPPHLGTPATVGLGNYPSPVVGPRGLGDTTFVVPARFDLQPFIQFTANLGHAAAQGSPPPLVISANDVQPRSTKANLNANLIVWGTPAENPVLSRLSGDLPLAMTAGPPARFSFANNLLLSVRDSTNLGILQEIASPWSPGRRVLVVSGTTPSALSLAVRGLDQPGLADNLALVSTAPRVAGATGGVAAGAPAPVEVSTYKITTKQRVASVQSKIVLLPVILAAGLALLALLMAFSMAYAAFVREPRGRR